MDIRAEEISKILKAQIKNYDARVSVAETGTILSVADQSCPAIHPSRSAAVIVAGGLPIEVSIRPTWWQRRWIVPGARPAARRCVW